MATIIKMEVAPPRYPVVTPEGAVKMVPLAPHVSTALESVDGEVVVKRAYESKGWVLLKDLYLQDGRQDLWKAWEDHQAARTKARKDSLQIDSFPDAYLPKEVHRRRAGHRPMAKTWKMPDLPPIDLSDEQEPAPAPRKGRPPKAVAQEG